MKTLDQVVNSDYRKIQQRLQINAACHVSASKGQWRAWFEVGTICISYMQFVWLDDDTIELQDIRTHPDFQRTGWATALLKRVVELYKPKSIIAKPESESGIPWLESFGFKQDEKSEWRKEFNEASTMSSTDPKD